MSSINSLTDRSCLVSELIHDNFWPVLKLEKSLLACLVRKFRSWYISINCLPNVPNGAVRECRFLTEQGTESSWGVESCCPICWPGQKTISLPFFSFPALVIFRISRVLNISCESSVAVNECRPNRFKPARLGVSNGFYITLQKAFASFCTSVIRASYPLWHYCSAWCRITLDFLSNEIPSRWTHIENRCGDRQAFAWSLGTSWRAVIATNNYFNI